MLFSEAARFEIEFCVRSQRKTMTADALTSRRAAAARVTRVRRTLPASAEHRCSRAANSWVPGRDAGSTASIDSEAISGERERALL